MVIFIVLILEIGIVMCWSMFITAKSYFEDYKLDPPTNKYALYCSELVLHLGVVMQVSNAVISCVNTCFKFGSQVLPRRIARVLLMVIIFTLIVNLDMIDTTNTFLPLHQMGNSKSRQPENGKDKICSQIRQESTQIIHTDSCIPFSEYSTEEDMQSSLDKVNRCPTVDVAENVNAVDEVHVDSETAKYDNETGNYQPASAYADTNEDTALTTENIDIDTVNLSTTTNPFEASNDSSIFHRFPHTEEDLSEAIEEVSNELAKSCLGLKKTVHVPLLTQDKDKNNTDTNFVPLQDSLARQENTLSNSLPFPSFSSGETEVKKLLKVVNVPEIEKAKGEETETNLSTSFSKKISIHDPTFNLPGLDTNNSDPYNDFMMKNNPDQSKASNTLCRPELGVDTSEEDSLNEGFLRDSTIDKQPIQTEDMNYKTDDLGESNIEKDSGLALSDYEHKLVQYKNKKQVFTRCSYSSVLHHMSNKLGKHSRVVSVCMAKYANNDFQICILKQLLLKKKVKTFFIIYLENEGKTIRRQVAKSVVREIYPIQRQYVVYPVGRMSIELPPPEERMQYEWFRLATFSSYTGNGNILSLARHGFYHDPSNGPSATRCFLCDVHVSHWEHQDDVSEEHRQRSPNCQFMGYRRPTGTCINDSMERSQRIQISRSSYGEVAGCQQQPREQQPRGTTERSGHSPVTLFRRSRRPDLVQRTTAVSNAIQSDVLQQNTASRRNLGIQETNPGHTGRTDPTITMVNNPKHPDYLNINTRVNSYHRWPDFLEQTARHMSEAGFFYLGMGDCVRCFWCGGSLQNWEQGEDPLLEHARWFPHCKFLKQRVGERHEAAVQRHHQEHMAEHQRQEELTQRRNEHNGSGVPVTTESVYREMGCPAVHTGRPVLNVRQETESNTRAAIGAGSALAAETYLPALGIFVPTSTLSTEASASTFRPASSTAATENQQSGSTTSTATYRGVSETRIQQTDSDIDQDVATLIEENRRLREALRCKICLDKDINIVLLPCGHLLCCKSCADRFQTCPVCRKIIEDKVKIYFSKC